MKRVFSLILAIAALALVAGCGGDDDGADGTAGEPLSAEEFRQELEQVDASVSQAFEAVFQTLEQVPDDVEVPEPAKEAAERAAEAERDAADRLEGLNPPEDAQEAVDGLVEEARAQADAIEEAAQQQELRVGELADAFEQHSPERYLNELEELGYLPDSDATEN